MPGVTLPPTAIVINELPVPGAGIGFVPNVTVTPLGWPEADNVMALLNPFKAVVLIVEVPLLPCCTVTEDGEALRNDHEYSYVAAWEYQGMDRPPMLHKEPLVYEEVHMTQRSYK